MHRRRHLLIAITLVTAWSFLLFYLSGKAVSVPFWVTALVLNAISFWVVFSCPDEPEMNAALFVLTYLGLSVFAGAIEHLYPGSEVNFGTAVVMFWATGFLALAPGLALGLLLRKLWSK